MREVVRCPHCGGTGEVRALLDGFKGYERWADWRTLKCGTCSGRGVLTSEEEARVEFGRRLREDRISRRLSLKEEAKRLGLDPLELSMKEWGRLIEEEGQEG